MTEYVILKINLTSYNDILSSIRSPKQMHYTHIFNKTQKKRNKSYFREGEIEIDGFPLKTSRGVDIISFKQLKYIKLALIKPITLITKQTLNTGIFPDK